jgi:hypothetical protein
MGIAQIDLARMGVQGYDVGSMSRSILEDVGLLENSMPQAIYRIVNPCTSGCAPIGAIDGCSGSSTSRDQCYNCCDQANNAVQKCCNKCDGPAARDCISAYSNFLSDCIKECDRTFPPAPPYRPTRPLQPAQPSTPPSGGGCQPAQMPAGTDGRCPSGFTPIQSGERDPRGFLRPRTVCVKCVGSGCTSSVPRQGEGPGTGPGNKKYFPVCK